MEGQLKTKDGATVPGARVTVLDENGVPHSTDITDEDGNYKVLLPAGNITVTASTGGIEEGGGQAAQMAQMRGRMEPGTRQRMLKQEQIQLDQIKMEVSEEQAMRKKVDRDGDGQWDYKIDEDFEFDSGQMGGNVFLDQNGDEEYNKENETLLSGGGEVIVEESIQGVRSSYQISSNGSYNISSLAPGSYSVKTSLSGSSTVEDVLVKSGEKTSEDIPVSVGELNGNISYEDVGKEKSVELSLENSDKDYTVVLGETKNYTFEDIIPGNYTLKVSDEDHTLKEGPKDISMEEKVSLNRDITIVKSYQVDGVFERKGEPLANQKISILGRQYDRIITTDDQGEFSVKLPEAAYRIYGTNRKDEATYVHLGRIVVDSDFDGDERYEGEFKEGYELSGQLKNDGEGVKNCEVFIRENSGAEYYLVTNNNGRFSTYLPKGTYTVYGWKESSIGRPGEDLYFLDKLRIREDEEITIEGSSARIVESHIKRDILKDDHEGPSEGLYATMETTLDNITVRGDTALSGSFKIALPRDGAEVTFDKMGYHEKTVTYSPFEEIPGNISLKAKDIKVEGEVNFDQAKTEELTLKFKPMSSGAVEKTITIDERYYEVALQPGEYEIVINESLENGEAKNEHSETISMMPSDERVMEKDLNPTYKVKVNGTIKDDKGILSSADIRFSGPEGKEVAANRSYEVYLEPGNYSIRAVNSEKGLSMQKGLSIDNSLTSSIDLENPVKVRAYLTYAGEGSSEIPVHFENEESGYVIETMSDMEGGFNLSLVEGDYNIKVDQNTEEEIDGMKRDVYYTLNETMHTNTLSTPQRLDMERNVLHSTFSGQVTKDGNSVSEVEVEILSQEGEVKKTLRTDEKGYFESDLLHGRYTIYVAHETSREKLGKFKYFVMPAENKSIEVSLEEGVTLSGRVLLKGEGVKSDVTLQRKEAKKTFSTQSNGDYRAVMPKGTYTIESEMEKDIEYGITTFKYEDQIELAYDEYQRIDLTKVKEYGMNIDELQTKTASQGEKISYTVDVTNTGNVRDEYEFSAKTAVWDIEFSPKTFELEAGDSRSVNIEVQVKDNASVDHPPIQFTLDSMNSEKMEEKELPIDVRQFYGVELSSDVINKRYGRGTITYSVNITNTGNGKDRYNIRVDNREKLRDQGWSVSVKEQTNNISDLQSKEIEVTLEAISSKPKENIRVEVQAYSDLQNSATDTVSIRINQPQLSIDSDSLDMDSEEANLEEEEFSLSNWQWGAIIIAVIIGALYIMKRRRWI
ncbi:MAG: carboxypeptidase regulatory-like domain-containing protein [Candidatus Thermoplasmatota archaeon]|nr:carboxypeptidase regulatory-like domain-containing protein [Candidatus Thermoplasmatota archaeon]